MDSLTLSWWAWLLAGIVLMALELMTPGGFFLFFFGVGAVLVGLLDLFGAHMPFALQGIVFVAISGVAIALFRKPMRTRFHRDLPAHKVDSLVGETAKALDDIPVDGIGSAELRGSCWSAHNIGTAPIPRSARVKVEKVEGLTLHVRG